MQPVVNLNPYMCENSDRCMCTTTQMTRTTRNSTTLTVVHLEHNVAFHVAVTNTKLLVFVATLTC